MTDNRTPTQPLPVRPASAGVINLIGDVDKNDIVAIVAVKFEEQLEQAKGRVARQISPLQDQIKQGEEDLQKDCQRLAKEFDLSAEKALARSLRDAGFGPFTAKAELTAVDETRQQVEIKVTLCFKNSSKNPYGPNEFDKSVTLPFSPEGKTVFKRLKADRQEGVRLNGRLAEVHKKLANIAALERKARAKLAEAALSRTQDGQAILADLAAVSDRSLPQFLLESK